MAETSGHLCPECGAPRGVDNTPSCGCTQRASDALRDAREAEQAAAEDFDPLRIRPYVDLESETREPEAPAPAPVPDATMQLRPISAPPQPSTTDLSLFENAPDHESTPDEPRPRSRRALILGAVGGALVTVVAAAGLASGLFSYDSPERDTALPEEVRASVPDASTSSAQASPETSGASARPTSASPTPSASPSTSASPSPSRTSASPTPSTSGTPSSTPTSTGPASTENSIGSSEESAPPVLTRGSQGEEVVELELRLTQLGLYTRKASGHYNEGVEDAVTRYQWARGIQVKQYGVYDLATREKLESETTEP